MKKIMGSYATMPESIEETEKGIITNDEKGSLFVTNSISNNIYKLIRKTENE